MQGAGIFSKAHRGWYRGRNRQPDHSTIPTPTPSEGFGFSLSELCSSNRLIDDLTIYESIDGCQNQLSRFDFAFCTGDKYRRGGLFRAQDDQ